jgi:hypothetical protein
MTLVVLAGRLVVLDFGGDLLAGLSQILVFGGFVGFVEFEPPACNLVVADRLFAQTFDVLHRALPSIGSDPASGLEAVFAVDAARSGAGNVRASPQQSKPIAALMQIKLTYIGTELTGSPPDRAPASGWVPISRKVRRSRER